jgi:hypothetical protein
MNLFNYQYAMQEDGKSPSNNNYLSLTMFQNIKDSFTDSKTKWDTAISTSTKDATDMMLSRSIPTIHPFHALTFQKNTWPKILRN